MRFRALLIRLILRLHWPPFLWVYRLCYWMAIQCSRILIRRIAGVQSIYLTGSWARQDVAYGLSDLDFKIFVVGKKRPDISQSIYRRFSLLRRFFPMLGAPDEKGIYFLDSFSEDYRHHPLIQHLFDTRFFRYQLLWGKDLLPNLPVQEWIDLDQGECAFARLKDWIERIHIYADYHGFSRQQKQHLYFKAVSDVALLALRADIPECGFHKRSDILRRIHPLVDASCQRLIENLVLENEEYYRDQRNSDEENFSLFKRMVSFCAQRISGQEDSNPLPLLPGFQPGPCSNGDPIVLNSLKAITCKIRAVTAAPWPQLPLNPFDLNYFDSPVYVVDCIQPIGLNEFHALKAYYRERLKDKAVLLIREHAHYLSSVDSDLVDHWASFPGSSDLLHLFVSDDPKILSKTLRKRIETRLRVFREQLFSILADPFYSRMDPAIFPVFLFNALRVLILSFEFQQGGWRWAVTPDEIVRFLITETPLEPAFLLLLSEQYKSSVDKQALFDERLLPKARALLSAMLTIVQSRGPWGSLSELNALPDRQHLTISMAIVTSNRPEQLRHCLESLAHLERMPQELIIVNDGRDPETQRVVKQSRMPLPVCYLESDQHGVACARNLAARSSAGDIIAFVDDDACLAPDWLERIERAFLRDSRIGLAAGSISNMDCGRNDLIWRFMETVEKI